MEGHDHQNLEISISGGGGGASRWNPTKEQIDMLENLYKQGLRTPSAEQIQQITNRLRSFGHIEGKNVFYWFQNHKARQRQKQKQDHHHHVSYVNRFLHKSSAHPPCPNVLCSPFYMPYPEMGLCQQQQQPKMLLPRSLKRRQPLLAERVPEMMKNKPAWCGRAVFEEANNNYHQPYCNHSHPNILHPSKTSDVNSRMKPYSKETLELFPMQPTTTSLSISPNSSDPVIISSSPLEDSCAVFPKSPFAAKCINNNVDHDDHRQGVSEGDDHHRTFFDFLM